jgi:hypothetical protein
MGVGATGFYILQNTGLRQIHRVSELGTEENIWTQEEGNNRRLQEPA